MGTKQTPKILKGKALLKGKGDLIISKELMRGVLESLRECHDMIEQNTGGIVVDEKDTARVYLREFGIKYKISKLKEKVD